MTIRYSKSVVEAYYSAQRVGWFRLQYLPDGLTVPRDTLRISGWLGSKGEIRFMSTWRSVHLGPVTIGIALGRAGQVPPIVPTSRTGAVSARTQFVSLVVATPRHWEELSPDEQDARLHDRV